jgi:RNA polymerase sigma-70 factor (ECF subfamily)
MTVPDPDAEPWQEAVAPDAAVRRALVESRGQLLGFLRRRLGSEDEAEEVLQDFVLRALARSKDLRDVRSVRGWLSRILATSIADHQRRAARRRQRETVMSPDHFDAYPAEPDHDLEEAVCNCLYKLLPTLRAEYAEVIWRIDLMGEDRATVAARLGITANTLGVRLHRARQALKRRLEEMCLTCPVHGYLDCGCEEAERIRRRYADARDAGDL